MGLRAHAGFWTGEQRMTKNTLTIELSPGTYHLVLKHPSSPAFFQPCGTFTLIISLSPIDASTYTIASRCHPAFGAGFLPIDLSAPDEGSALFGGPINFGAKYGSVLRGSAIITDLHDGRKKTYLSIPPDIVGAERGKILLKVGTHGDRLLTLTVQETEGRTLDPSATSTQRHFALYELVAGGNYWIAFHRDHRMRDMSSCERVNFFLAVATSTAAADVLQPFCAKYVDGQNSLRGGVRYIKNRVIDTVEIPLDGRVGAYHVFRAAFSFVHSEVMLVAVTRNVTYTATLQFAHVDSGNDGPPLTAAQVVVVPSRGGGNVVVRLKHSTMFGAECGPVHFSHRVVTHGPILPLESFPVPPEVDFSLIGIGKEPSLGDSKAPIEHNPVGDIKLWTWDSARFPPSLLTSGRPFRVEDATYRRAHLHEVAPRPFEEDDDGQHNDPLWNFSSSVGGGSSIGLPVPEESGDKASGNSGNNEDVDVEAEHSVGTIVQQLGNAREHMSETASWETSRGTGQANTESPLGFIVNKFFIAGVLAFLAWRTTHFWWPKISSVFGFRRQRPIRGDSLQSVVEDRSEIQCRTYGSF